ncbi:MAG: AAA family ATPase [Flavobacteriales bacterium]|nr:AAA family ATPase [Flavobacteriales bacterium]
MADTIAELHQWLAERPKWQQDAARRLAAKAELDGDDLKHLTDLCLKEAGFVHPDLDPLEFQPIDKKDLAFNRDGQSLALNSIGDVKGINALAPRKALELGAGMTIVYGSNGSGKSGYTRILKAVAGIPSETTLLGNVFEPPTSAKSCSFEYTLGGVLQPKLTWIPTEGPQEHLRAIALYDTELGSIYVTKEKEVAIEPPPVALLRRLAETCIAVTERIKNDRKGFRTSKLRLPDDYVATDYGKRYNGLAATTTIDQLEALCLWSEELEEKLKKVDERYRAPGAAVLVSKVGQEMNHRKQIHAILTNCVTKLSAEAATNLAHARKDATAKRQAANDAAQKVFADAPLGGVGSPSWRLMWDHARAYSEAEAYRDLPYPNVVEEANCVLCQQPLADRAKNRLMSFEEYVKSRTAADAQAAEQKIHTLINGLPGVTTWETLEPLVTLAGVKMEENVAMIKTYRQALADRENALIERKSSDEVPALPTTTLLDSLAKSIAKREIELKQHQEDAKKDNRDHILKELREVQCQKWCSGELERLKMDNAFLKMVVAWDKAEKLCDTGNITSKNGALYKELVTNEYLDRFKKELAGVGGSRIKVHLAPTKNSKGVSYYRVSLNEPKLNASLATILSEGEQRLVSIAAFIADLTGRVGSTPFVFDDPISSLDQDFEEAVAQRLVDLSSDRQVIVFTHRLSLLFELESRSERAKPEHEVKVLAVVRQPWGAGEPQGPPMPAQKPKKALNTLVNNRLDAAKKKLEQEGFDAYYIEAKAICSDIRITIERLIENDLLSGVVERFKRPISTLRLPDLQAIEPSDCQVLDAMMSKYSRYEHPQPIDAPIALPDVNEIKTDLEALINWLGAFDTKKKALGVK